MHAQKLTLSETKAILAHDLRRNKTYSNKDIDLSKKDDNIIFTENYYKFINQHIDDKNIYVYGRHKRDDINYAVSIVLHYPEECNIPENLFFKMANKIFENKYGKDNVICSVVHKDEVRSHLHFVFMPVVKDKKKDRLKLCAKDVINRDTLKMLHTEIEEEFKKIYSKGVKLQNEEKGQFKNIEHIEDYKKFKDLEKEYNKIKQDIEPLQTQKQELEIDNYILTNQVETLKQEYAKLKKKFDDNTNDNENLKNQIAILQKQIKQLEEDRQQKQIEAEEARKYYNNKKMTFEEVKADIDKNCNEAIKDYQKQKDEEVNNAKKAMNEKASNELTDYKMNLDEVIKEQKNKDLEDRLKSMGLTHKLQINDIAR